jgi:hypothetical protein
MSKFTRNRPAIVEGLIADLIEALKEYEHDPTPMEVVHAGLRFTQHAIRHVVENSGDDNAEFGNQQIICAALDAVKLDTVRVNGRRVN